MSAFDIQLLLTALASVLVLVALIVSRIRMHPLLALLVVSIGVGFATGMEPVASSRTSPTVRARPWARWAW